MDMMAVSFVIERTSAIAHKELWTVNLLLLPTRMVRKYYCMNHNAAFNFMHAGSFGFSIMPASSTREFLMPFALVQHRNITNSDKVKN